jgi:hypothetical protein
MPRRAASEVVMTWACPYLNNDGSCRLREDKACDPMERGCILRASEKYKRLSDKDAPAKD